MAVVKPGSIVADIRGSVGDETYTRNRGGICVRARTSPSQPASPDRDAVQAAYTAISQAWSATLTDAQRHTWRTYAARHTLPDRFGRPRNLTGLNHFIRSDIYRYRVTSDIGYIVAPLYAPPPLVAFDFTAQVAGNIATIALDFPTLQPIPHGVYLWAFLGKPVNPGVNYYRSPYRYADWNFYSLDHWLNDPFILYNPWTHVAGQKVFATLVATFLKGATSGRWQTSAIIT